MRFVLLLGLLSLPCFSTTIGAAVEVCNNSRIPISIVRAYVPFVGIFQSEVWKVSGWYRIESDDCKKFRQVDAKKTQFFGFQYVYKGERQYFRPKINGETAIIPGVIFDTNASARFNAFDFDRYQVCVNNNDAFEYESEKLNTYCTQGVQGQSRFPLTVEFDPRSDDVDDQTTIRLKINIDHMLDN